MTAETRSPGGSLPPRIAARPDPGSWGEHELMTLRESACLMWPDGPLTARSLRTAAEAGQLPVTMVAGKLFTTLAALRELSRCEKRTVPASPARPGRATRSETDRPEDAHARLMRRLADMR